MQMMDESIRLLAFQQMLEKDTDGKEKFIGASINETIIKCITTGLHKRADKARADWKVPDKRFVFRFASTQVWILTPPSGSGTSNFVH